METNWDTNDDRESVFKEVPNTPIASIVTSNVSFFVKNHSACTSILVSRLFVNESIRSDVSSWTHDLAFVQ